MKFVNPFKKKTVAIEVKNPDMSIWENDVPLYIETEAMSERSNKFREHYRKVALCIMNATNIGQVESCKKLYNNFKLTHKLTMDNHTHARTYVIEKAFVDTICGYLENLIQQKEMQYSMTVVYDQIPNVAPMTKPKTKHKDASM